MAFNNTSERFNYIYGNTAKKVERFSDYYGETSPRVEQPVRKNRPKSTGSARTLIKTNDVFDWRFTLMIIGAVAVIALAALFYVRETSHMTQMAKQIRVLKQEKAELQSKQVSIKSELDKAVNLDEIRSYAEDELDMVYPDHDDVIYYDKDTNDYFRQFESVN